MKFCQQCQNMLYIGIDAEDTNKLTYYCRHCGAIDELINTEGHCVLNTQLKQGEQKFNHIINQYTKMDPTLPRIYTMKCPNEGCITNVSGGDASNKKEKTEIIYMRYDDSNMKYVYICVDCDTIWKTDDRK
jgi:DNA-directed RNA polymerase subunit M/transcription elongation factor TFIIS